MIETCFGLGTLGSPLAFAIAAVVGIIFGFFLEQAGFGSSRKLSSVFYLTDMAVLKVMFTAVITAMMGFTYLSALGLIRTDSVYLLPTIYGAQIAGGLLLGAGFVIGGWCPGTAIAGIASGRLDALLFLIGGLAGSILFNEMFPLVKPLYSLGDRGIQFVYETLKMPKPAFIFLFTIAGVLCFWISEYAEKRRGRWTYLYSPFLVLFSLALVLSAWGIALLIPVYPAPPAAGITEKQLLQTVEAGLDHFEPEELADRLMGGEKDLLLVDIRPAAEFRRFHIRGAVNVEIPQLVDYLHPHMNKGIIVLYSNGMTHPAQARDSLARLGYANVYALTDGLNGFTERCLKPISLRDEPLPPDQAARVAAWRRYFLPR
jgi:thiosulfate/3-mercaptopyruvate sulfurtransferase